MNSEAEKIHDAFIVLFRWKRQHFVLYTLISVRESGWFWSHRLRNSRIILLYCTSFSSLSLKFDSTVSPQTLFNGCFGALNHITQSNSRWNLTVTIDDVKISIFFWRVCFVNSCFWGREWSSDLNFSAIKKSHCKLHVLKKGQEQRLNSSFVLITTVSKLKKIYES